MRLGSCPVMPAPYRRMQCTRGSPGGREAVRRGGEGPGGGRGLKLQARLEDLTVWQMETVKQSRKGFET